MSVTKLDLKLINTFVTTLKANSMISVDLDLLWFCNDFVEKTSSIISPINEDIDSLNKWYTENVDSIQKEYSEKNADGSIKTFSENGGEYIVFKDDMMELYKNKMNEITMAANAKTELINAKLNEEVHVDIQKIPKACLPKNMITAQFDAIIKFVER